MCILCCLQKKRLEAAFRTMLKAMAPPIDPVSNWDNVRSKLVDEPAFLAIENEDERKAIFVDYVDTIAVSSKRHLVIRFVDRI